MGMKDGEDEEMPSSPCVATRDHAHSICCPHVRVKCSDFGTVVPEYEACKGSCYAFGFVSLLHGSRNEWNSDICWCVRTETLAPLCDDDPCQDDEVVLPPEGAAATMTVCENNSPKSD